MLKSFSELRKVDVSGKTKKLGEYDYLPWLDCIDLLMEHGAETPPYYDMTDAVWTEVNGKKQALVKVFVEIDGVRRSITHPVALGEFSTEDPTALQLGFAIQRAFVKCVAINWGLGLDLWKKDIDAAVAPPDNNLGMKITMAFGARVPEFGSADELHKKLGSSKQFLHKLITEGSRGDQQAFLEKIQAL